MTLSQSKVLIKQIRNSQCKYQRFSKNYSSFQQRLSQNKSDVDFESRPNILFTTIIENYKSMSSSTATSLIQAVLQASKRTFANEQTNEYQAWFLLLVGQSTRIGLNVVHMYDDSLAQYQGIFNPRIHTLTFWVMKPRKLEEVLSKINKTVNTANKKDFLCVDKATAYKE